MERSAASLEQRNLLLPQEQRGAFVKRAVPKGERFHNRRPRCRGASTRCDLQRGVYRARSARAAGSGGAICRWQADGMDRNAAAVCEPRRTGGRFSYAGERRSGHRSRHGGGLRREAYQRRGCRGRTTGARGGKARKSCLDTRRGVHLGILPPRGCDRSQKRRRGRRHADGLGISQLPFRHVWIETPYDVANQLAQYHQVPLVLRSGSYRGLAATANHFARETHMDALARAAKADPLEFRLKNLSNARMRAVLEAATKSFGWPRKKTQEGQGFGLACGAEKGSYVAACAEAAVDRASGDVRVVRVVEAFECGAIVNPAGLRNQVVGAIIQGLGGALFEAVEFENGQIKNPRFATYRVPRFRDVPEIEAVLLDRKDIPSAGAGETPIMAVAPAIGNAIFDATGIRLNNLPMVPNGLRSA